MNSIYGNINTNVNIIPYTCTFCGKLWQWGHQCDTASSMQGFCNDCGRAYYGSHICIAATPMFDHRLTCTSGGACLECDQPNVALKELMRETATRHNQGKVDLSLLPRVASLEQCKVWMRGEQKYGRENWKKLWGADTINVAGASAMRHLLSLLSGEVMDRETGLPHAAHVSCNMSMILEWMAREGMIQPEVYETSEKGDKE